MASCPTASKERTGLPWTSRPPIGVCCVRYRRPGGAGSLATRSFRRVDPVSGTPRSGSGAAAAIATADGDCARIVARAAGASRAAVDARAETSAATTARRTALRMIMGISEHYSASARPGRFTSATKSNREPGSDPGTWLFTSLRPTCAGAARVVTLPGPSRQRRLANKRAESTARSTRAQRACQREAGEAGRSGRVPVNPNGLQTGGCRHGTSFIHNCRAAVFP